MICMGIDPSLTSTGIVVLDGDVVRRALSIVPKKLSALRRLAFIRDQVLAVAASEQPELIGIEGYSFGSRQSQAHALGELGGVLRLALWEAGFKYADVPPSTLKKLATGKGNAPKDVVRLEVSKRWGFEHDSNDVVDAFVLATAAHLRLGGRGRRIADARVAEKVTIVTGWTEGEAA